MSKFGSVRNGFWNSIEPRRNWYLWSRNITEPSSTVVLPRSTGSASVPRTCRSALSSTSAMLLTMRILPGARTSMSRMTVRAISWTTPTTSEPESASRSASLSQRLVYAASRSCMVPDKTERSKVPSCTRSAEPIRRMPGCGRISAASTVTLRTKRRGTLSTSWTSPFPERLVSLGVLLPPSDPVNHSMETRRFWSVSNAEMFSIGCSIGGFRSPEVILMVPS